MVERDGLAVAAGDVLEGEPRGEADGGLAAGAMALAAMAAVQGARFEEPKHGADLRTRRPRRN